MGCLPIEKKENSPKIIQFLKECLLISKHRKIVGIQKNILSRTSREKQTNNRRVF